MPMIPGIRDDLQAKKEAVDGELRRLLPAGPSALHEAMRYAVLSGGKRFRPLLLLCAGEGFGAGRAELLPFGCAMELIHNYSLVHDDLPSMDNDDFRRGLPSCHKAYGEAVALLAGDGLLSLAFEVMADAPAPGGRPDRKERAVREIGRASGSRGMILGQWMDICIPAADMTSGVFEEIMRKKTGALITAAVKAGAILGGASDPALGAIEEYGRHVGQAFQIRDDIMDAGAEAGKKASGPNCVHFYGREEAARGLEEHVEAAVAALRRVPCAIPELECLASDLALR